jgi:predicted nuclease of predicted toxin-antitoxin system
MKILLDECVPAKLCKHFSPHDCITVTRTGLSGCENGELLRKAEELGFDVLITVDRNLPTAGDLKLGFSPANRASEIFR